MITCTITIVEVPGKGYRIDLTPEQSTATPREMVVAGIIECTLEPVMQWLSRQGARAEEISGDCNIVEKMIQQQIREFDAQPGDVEPSA